MPVRLAQAFATCTRERVQVLVVLSDGVLFNYRSQIGVLALRHRLPAISSVSEYAEAGLLLAYGPDLRDLFRRAAPLSTRFSRVRNRPTCRSNNPSSTNWF
jgi:putative ABC transport system substrate-binding protein